MRLAALILIGGSAATFGSGAALAQSTAPSSITPPTLRPPAPVGPGTAVIPRAEAAAAPSNAADLRVRVSAIEVEGVFPEVSARVRALVTPFAGREVTLTQIYALAAEIEAVHVQAGFILARVSVPPQTLRPDGPVRLVVTDGFVEVVDVSGVPLSQRWVVAHRAGGLVGHRHLRLRQIEQPLLLAGDVPGVALTSTLTRGDQPGGTRLLLSARRHPVSGIVTADNGFSPALGRYGVTAQVSLNSLAGLGEQIYGFVTSGYDLQRALRDNAPVRVLGGGFVLPTPDGRFFLNPEVTFARTQPLPQPFVPRTRGRLRRLSLRGGYVVQRTRSSLLSIGATFEHVREANDAIDFGLGLSLDEFYAGRLRVNYSSARLLGGGFAATVQLSHGLGGRDARFLDPFDFFAVGGSRQGAGPFFTKLDGSLQYARSLPAGIQATLTVRGQTTFGVPLFRSEQSALEGSDALSAYVGGVTAMDESVTGRVEVAHALALLRIGRLLPLAPYVFAAAGHGWLDAPTAVEAPRTSAANAGAGLRGTIGRTGLSFGVEYAHGWSTRADLDQVNRVSGSVALRF